MNYYYSCKDKVIFFIISGFGSGNLCPPSLRISKGVMVDERLKRQGRPSDRWGWRRGINNGGGAVWVREDEGEYYNKDQEGGKKRKAQRGRFWLPEEEKRINGEETKEPERDGDQIWRAGDKRSDKNMEEEKQEEDGEGG